jgi:hypothetical protein
MTLEAMKQFVCAVAGVSGFIISLYDVLMRL